MARIVACVLFDPVPTITACPPRRTRARPSSMTMRFSSASSAARFTRGAQRDDSAHARGRVLVTQAFDRADVDRALRVERRDQGNPDAAEIEVARHAHERTSCRRTVPGRCARPRYVPWVSLWLLIAITVLVGCRDRRALGDVRHRRRGRLHPRDPGTRRHRAAGHRLDPAVDPPVVDLGLAALPPGEHDHLAAWS